MEVNGAGRAQARTVTFTGIGSIALLGSVFISAVLEAIHSGIRQNGIRRILGLIVGQRD